MDQPSFLAVLIGLFSIDGNRVAVTGATTTGQFALPTTVTVIGTVRRQSIAQIQLTTLTDPPVAP